jgi:hypothetical protein
MPLQSTRGGASAKGFGFGAGDGATPFIIATGGTVTTSGDYKIHTFTGPGTFEVTNRGTPAGSNSVEYLVVAGGGAGGTTDYSAGGGGGGFRQNFPSPATGGLPVAKISYPITIGAGGSGLNGSGTDSIFSTITSTGGGFGGSYTGPQNNGGPGGSGGGGASNAGIGGSGNTPPVSPSQGNPGGNGDGDGGGGGGGSGGSGTPSSGGRSGGPGTATSISGPSVTYSAGNRGIGAGTPAGPSGGANTGSAGGAVNGTGGSGIVVIRYKFQ